MLNSMHPRTWEYVSFDWKSGELTSKMELHIHIIQYVYTIDKGTKGYVWRRHLHSP